jgi:metal-responsive CopG/Arc/MetJ family transcriptional regulator
MKQKMYIRPISIVLSIEMFDQIKEITDQRNIAISEFIREATQEKLNECNNRNKLNKIY